MSRSEQSAWGAPSPEEVAAIIAAVELTWPKQAVPAASEARRAAGWRFSGRWWAPDDVVRRRPLRGAIGPRAGGAD